MSGEESYNSPQTLTEHLEELRSRLIRILLIVFVGFVIAYSQSEELFDLLRKPIQPYLKEGGLIYTGVMDKFVAHLKVSGLASLLLTSPFWLYEVWKFVAPGLYRKEKKYAVGFLFFGSALFTLGASFVYFVVYPMAFEFLFHFGGDVDIAMITIDDYLSFFALMTLAFGISFELPLVLTILGMAGIVDSDFLTRNRRYAIVGLAFISAIVTPPDALSMALMLLPMCLLYELSIVLVGIFGPKTDGIAPETRN